MCGITGMAALAGGEPPNRERLQVMSDSLTHRGPDDEGMWIDECGVGLAMRRLSIIDLETGQQPIFNEDRTVCTVFNGEIYNYRELRRELIGKGHQFASETDGEVIVHLWEEHGPDCLPRLNGMFAIAVLDTRSRRLALARDRLGIKPLFWSRTPHHCVFGSEIKAILASGLVYPALDHDALKQFLAWEYVPAPATLFRGVRKLEPATMLILDLETGGEQSRVWWDLPEGHSEVRRDDDEWADRVDAKISECVRRQLVSDVPLGAFLSGGVDSTLVVSAMGRPRAFTIGFEDPTYDESRWAEQVASHLDVNHRVERLRPQAAELFDDLMNFMEDPIGDFSIFPTYLVSRLAREEVTVALSGDGGDELFGGYETFVAERIAAIWSRAPGVLRRRMAEPWLRGLRPRRQKKGLINKARRFAEGLEHDPRLQHARWRLFLGEAQQRKLFSEAALENATSPLGEHIYRLQRQAGQRPDLDRQLYVDLKSYLAENCLVKVDRMSMACSLEVRVPLLDHELVELAFRVPPHLKLRRSQTKVLLKKIAARHVPRDCVYRTKQGFSMPIKEWLRGELRPLMEELLAPDRLKEHGLFRTALVERLKKEHIARQSNHSHVLWALMVFQDWKQRWNVA